MDVRQARYFAAACHGGSLSAAARELGVSVQAASKAVAEIESEVAEPLFVRSDRGVVPTAAGLGLLARVEPFLESFASLEEFVHDPQGCMSGDASALSGEGGMRLRLALCSPPVAGVMDMRARFESSISKTLGIAVSLVVMNVPDALGKLRDGGLDCIFSIGQMKAGDLHCVPYGSLRAGVLMSLRHPLAGTESVSLDDLAPYRVINSPYYDGCGGSIFDVYMEHGLKSEPLVPASMEGYKTAMLEENAYVFSVYLPSLRQYEGYLVIKSLVEADSVPIPQCLVTLKGQHSAAYKALEHLALTNLAALVS